jgi:hypothetical protein
MPFEPTEEESRVVGEHFGYLQSLRDATGQQARASPRSLASGVVTHL